MRRKIARTALATLAITCAWSAVASAAITEPHLDSFYTGKVKLKGVPRGTIYRTRHVSIVGYGVPDDSVNGTQILYRSTDSKGRPIAAVTTLMVPTTAYPGSGPRPLVGYQEAIDSLGDQCNPGYTLRSGTNKEYGQMKALLALGYAVTATDFEGQHSAFAAGPLAGRTVLDGVKAAEALKGTGLTGVKTPLGLFGYSGGSQATMWAAELQPTYAPTLNLKGIAGGGTPADIELSVKQILGGPFAGLGFLGVFGVAREYPELGLDTLLNAKGKQLRKALSDACLLDAAGSYPFAKIEDYTNAKGDPFALPAVQAVLAELHLGKVKPRAPVYLYHSVADELIPVGVEDAFATRLCSLGARVQYTREASGDHNTEAIAGSPQAFLWLADRFNGAAAPTNCGSFPKGAFSPGYEKSFDCHTVKPVSLKLKRIRHRRPRRVAVYLDQRRIASRKAKGAVKSSGHRGRKGLKRVRLRGLQPGYAEFVVRTKAHGHKRVRKVNRILKCG